MVPVAPFVTSTDKWLSLAPEARHHPGAQEQYAIRGFCERGSRAPNATDLSKGGPQHRMDGRATTQRSA